MKWLVNMQTQTETALIKNCIAFMIEYNFQIILFYFKILFYGCQKITEVLSSKLNNP